MDEPLVLYASLSCAACLMFLTGKIGRDAEEFYTEKVLDLLIPLLSSEKATSSNQALLATTVILRMSEQFLEPGNDCQRHLKGAASLFMDGTDWSGIEVNLATACFWTHLRESIRKPYWTGDDSQDSYGSSLLKVVTDHGLLNGVSALDDLTTIKVGGCSPPPRLQNLRPRRVSQPSRDTVQTSCGILPTICFRCWHHA